MECPASLKGVKEEDIVVWVDPLDGTSEYTQGIFNIFLSMTAYLQQCACLLEDQWSMNTYFKYIVKQNLLILMTVNIL